MCITGTSPSPTAEIYGDLQIAYAHFARELFNDTLPPCLITLQRKGGKKRRTYGYFAPKRFGNSAGSVSDEIALNPKHFRHRPPIEVMSTLVHEMVHLWQHHFGRPSRSGYHNKEWAQKMLWIGLHPSHTGHLGGRMTGQQMTHSIVPEGRFAHSARRVLAQSPGISWFDIDAIDHLPRGPEDIAEPTRSGRRAKFQCPECADQAWGKASLNLICGDCDRTMRIKE